MVSMTDVIYENEVKRKLSDDTTYKRLSVNPFPVLV